MICTKILAAHKAENPCCCIHIRTTFLINIPQKIGNEVRLSPYGLNLHSNQWGSWKIISRYILGGFQHLVISINGKE